MKTTLITIAITSLIALNANAATFVMQAKIPSADLQVLEGNKGSEVPVNQGQPSNPQTPTWIPSDFPHEDFILSSGFGVYSNMNCNSVAKLAIGEFGYLLTDQVIENFDHFNINGNVLVQDMNSGIYSQTDENGNSFLFYDTNQNWTLDNNELSFYFGNMINSYPANINGVNYTIEEYSLCTQ